MARTVRHGSDIDHHGGHRHAFRPAGYGPSAGGKRSAVLLCGCGQTTFRAPRKGRA